jgi:5-methyltetrahydrofolate--homocysteine methyltransferase
MKPLVITALNRNEAIRYMGQADGQCDDKLQKVMDECEKIILNAVKPRYLYKCFEISECEEGVSVIGTSLILKGNDIKKHLKGCDRAVLMCATLSSDIDRQIRVAELSDILRALALDCLASTAVEQLCDKVELLIKEEFGEYEMTFRYGLGYGDLPISQQNEFLTVLNAPKVIGLNVTESNILTPRKSVTAIIGLSKNKIPAAKRGCAVCNMREICSFRKKGNHCNA